jgi:hypothetical protein
VADRSITASIRIHGLSLRNKPTVEHDSTQITPEQYARSPERNKKRRRRMRANAFGVNAPSWARS